jgi:hypothetical protein
VVRPGLSVLVSLVLVLFAAPVSAHAPRSTEEQVDQVAALLAPSSEASASFAGSTAEAAFARTPAFPGRPGPGAIEAISILIVALGLVGSRRVWQRERPAAVASAIAGLLLGFVVETTPHLVHHSLDADQGAGCQALQTAERNQAVVVAPDTIPATTPASLDEPRSLVSGPTPFAPAPCGRAPPA